MVRRNIQIHHARKQLGEGMAGAPDLGTGLGEGVTGGGGGGSLLYNDDLFYAGGLNRYLEL